MLPLASVVRQAEPAVSAQGFRNAAAAGLGTSQPAQSSPNVSRGWGGGRGDCKQGRSRRRAASAARHACAAPLRLSSPRAVQLSLHTVQHCMQHITAATSTAATSPQADTACARMRMRKFMMPLPFLAHAAASGLLMRAHRNGLAPTLPCLI